MSREMKDSGVEWIGAIPKDWNVCKQKHLIQMINGRAYKDSEFQEEGKYKVLRVGNLFTNPNWYYSDLELEKDKYCDNGDLLYTWSMSYAPVIWRGEKVIYHYHIWKTKISYELDKKFAYYYLLSLTASLMAEKHETTMSFVTMGVMNNSYITYPHLTEQHRIADFLDAKCAQIAEISKKIQEEIDTLEEYKKSVIIEAVTKGLDPDAEMKDSGDKWIGKIPVEWDIKKGKYIFDIFGGSINEKNLSFTEEHGWKPIVYYKVDDMNNTSDGYYMQQKNHYYTNSNVVPFKAPLILIPKRGAAISTNKVRITNYDCYFDPNVMALSTSDDIRYYQYVLVGRSLVDIADINTIPQINNKHINSLVLPAPPLEIQKTIADYLDERCCVIRNAIEQKNKQLSILEEYKKSLIYEYVTGKKEVA